MINRLSLFQIGLLILFTPVFVNEHILIKKPELAATHKRAVSATGGHWQSPVKSPYSHFDSTIFVSDKNLAFPLDCPEFTTSFFQVEPLSKHSKPNYIRPLSVLYVSYEEKEIDPVMHAFLVNYLNRHWKISYREAEQLAYWILKYSYIYEVDPLVQLARILKESGGRHYLLASRGGNVRVVRGRAGEIGFSQIAPSWIGKTIEGVKLSKEVLFDPEGNILAGIALYKRYERMSDGYLMALTKYNRPGSRRVNSYALQVNKLYEKILSEYFKFRLLQPSVYSWEI